MATCFCAQPSRALDAMAPSEQKVKCPYCRRLFKPTGVGNHKRACKKKLDAAAQESQFISDLLAEPQRAFYMPTTSICVIIIRSGSLPVPRFSAPWQKDARVGQSSMDVMDPLGLNR